MRGTIHLVSARDCLMLRPLVQPAVDRGLSLLLGRQLAGVDTAALAAAGRVLVEERPLTFSELGAALSAQWPQHPPAALAQGVRALVPLVQVPPRAVWGAAGQAAHTSAEAWLGRPTWRPAPSLDRLVTRYLAAFGPASVQDAQAWSGLTRLREVVDRLRPGLRAFRDEQGAELFDLPGAPRPDPDTPAPVRLVAEFDNLVLSHADRARIISEPNRQRMFTPERHLPRHRARRRVRRRHVEDHPVPRGRGADHRAVRAARPARPRRGHRRGRAPARVRGPGRPRRTTIRFALPWPRARGPPRRGGRSRRRRSRGRPGRPARPGWSRPADRRTRSPGRRPCRVRASRAGRRRR